jgi:hypothetical protein
MRIEKSAKTALEYPQLSDAAGPWVESERFVEMLAERNLGSRDRLLAERFHRDGFVVIDDVDITPDIDVDRMWDEIAGHCASGRVRGDVDRASDAWRSCVPVYEIATHPAVIDVLRMLYGREPRPFQTLNFLHGTEQETHSDTIHFSARPARFMCGVWLALEDITLAQGPLHYYERSQKLPEFDYEDLGIAPITGNQTWDNPQTRERYSQYEKKISEVARESGFKRSELAIKKGSFLVWASNLLHGGSPRQDPILTRKSQVTHYYFDDTIRFTPMFSEKSKGVYAARFIDDMTTGVPIPDRINHRPVVWLPCGMRHSFQVFDAAEAERLGRHYLRRYRDVCDSAFGKPELAFSHFSRVGARENREFLNPERSAAKFAVREGARQFLKFARRVKRKLTSS